MSDTVPCPSCGKPVAQGDRFCSSCGTAVVEPSTAVTDHQDHDVGTNPTQCPKCGAAMGRDDRFCPQCGTSRPEAPTVVSHVSLRNAQAGRLIDATRGEFEIIQQLGTGAMGAVYLAKDIALGRRVAIKVIAPNLLSDATMVSRFRLEAQTVASLRHPNIVNVHAVRQADDLHYFVMEFIDGPPLRSIVKEHAPLDIDVVRAVVFQVGSALSYAHRTGGGVIHRDVKPANIMVDREGDAFVTDFGISKIAEAQSGLTQTGATIGTPEYMSPEQCRGEALTGASDQYALGIVAYEMICGHTPFSGSQYYIMVAHTSEQPKPIREVRPDCPAHVAEAVERMLAKTPAERWPDLDHAAAAMGGAPLGYQDPVRTKIKTLTGATLLQVPAVGTGASGGASTLDTATSVTVTGLPPVLETGERYQLRAEVKSGKTSLSGLGVLWASTHPAIARVEGGWVEALRPGSVSITASAGNVASSVLLTVAEPSPARVLVRPSSVRMHRGGRIGLTAQVQDRRGRELQRDVRWRSSDTSIATVTQDGEVVAKGDGPVTVTAESDDASGTAEIVVEAPAVETAPQSVVQTPSPPAARASPAAGATPLPPSSVPPTKDPAHPRPAPPRPAQAAARPRVRRPATIAASLVAVLGLAVLGIRTMTSGGGEAVPESDVAPSGPNAFPPPAGVDREPGPSADAPTTAAETALSPVAGEPAATTRAPPREAPQTAPTRAAPEPPTTAETEPSPPPSRPEQTGPPGAPDVPAAAAPRPTPSRVAIGLPTASMRVGSSQTAGAQVFAAGGVRMEAGSYSLAWRSSDPAVVSVNARSGSLSASSPGSAWVVATAGDVRDSVRVTVAATVAAVDIAESDVSIEVGASRALSASVLDPDGGPVSRTVTWSSSDPTVATVDGTGRVTSVGPGVARITASAEGFSDQVTVSVADTGPALPPANVIRSALEPYVASLGQGDSEAVTRYWGADDTGPRDELLDLMGERNFTAALDAIGEPSLDGSTVVIPFQVATSYRTFAGANRNRMLSFQARLQRSAPGWQLTSVALR